MLYSDAWAHTQTHRHTDTQTDTHSLTDGTDTRYSSTDQSETTYHTDHGLCRRPLCATTRGCWRYWYGPLS